MPLNLTISLTIYTILFLYGIVIGSFLNVCIYRLPKGESVAGARSHCMICGHQLAWYELVPVFSFLALKGRCKGCKTAISIQYPMVEVLNGILYLIIFMTNGWNGESILYCLMTSALLVLSVIDFRTFEIPFGINVYIAVLGMIRIMMDPWNWQLYVVGGLIVSGALALLFYVSKGRAIGGGDIKLMAAAGLVIGWKLILLAFFLGCIYGSVIHIVRMKIAKADRVLALGPYLSMGIFTAMLWGEQFLSYYFEVILNI